MGYQNSSNGWRTAICPSKSPNWDQVQIPAPKHGKHEIYLRSRASTHMTLQDSTSITESSKKDLSIT